MKEVDKVFDELAGMKDTEMHSISNMALVDQPTNSALQNFLLDTKRSILQDRSKASAESGKHTFVPISTEMAFGHYLIEMIIMHILNQSIMNS